MRPSRIPLLFAGGAWSPAKLNGYVDHMIEDGMTEAGGSVSSWAGQSGAAIAVQDTSAHEPGVDTLNGHTVLALDGIDDFLTSAEAGGAFPSMTAPYTIYGIMKRDSTTSGDMIMGAASTTYFYGPTSAARYQIWFGDTPYAVGGADTSWHRFAVGVDSGSLPFCDIDGSNIITGLSIVPLAWNSLIVGGWSSGTHDFHGKIAVLIFQDAAATNEEKAEVDTWLAAYGAL